MQQFHDQSSKPLRDFIDGCRSGSKWVASMLIQRRADNIQGDDLDLAGLDGVVTSGKSNLEVPLPASTLRSDIYRH